MMNLEYLLVISFVVWLNINLFFDIKKNTATMTLIFLLILTLYSLISNNPLLNFFYLVSLLVSFIGLIIGILGDRKYLYILSIIFFILIPILIFLKQEKYAEFMAANVFLLLSLAFLRDFLYEKIFN